MEGPDLDKARRAFELYASGIWSETTLADELGLTEAGLAEILVNSLYAGRAVRHKGRPDEEERPTTCPAPIDQALAIAIPMRWTGRCARSTRVKHRSCSSRRPIRSRLLSRSATSRNCLRRGAGRRAA